MKCKVRGCEGQVEANASIWFSYDEKLGWSIYGVGDEASQIVCDTEGHDNSTPLMAKELEAFIEYILPGSGWVASDPRHEKGEGVSDE